MSWLLVPDLILILSAGAALGFFGGLFGIGGGLIAVPLFVLGFGMDQATAQGTALVLMVPNLVMGFLKYQQKHPVPLKQMALLATTATLTTWAISNFALLLPPLLLQTLFNCFLIFAAWRMWASTTPRAGQQQFLPLRESGLPVVGVLGGTSMGLLGMGGGLVATPLITTWLRQPQVVAQSLSLALVTPCSMVALASFANAHKVNWSLGLPMAAGGMAAVSAGVALAHRLPDKTLKRSFALLMVVTGLVLITRAAKMAL